MTTQSITPAIRANAFLSCRVPHCETSRHGIGSGQLRWSDGGFGPCLWQCLSKGNDDRDGHSDGRWGQHGKPDIHGDSQRHGAANHHSSARRMYRFKSRFLQRYCRGHRHPDNCG